MREREVEEEEGEEEEEEEEEEEGGLMTERSASRGEDIGLGGTTRVRPSSPLV